MFSIAKSFFGATMALFLLVPVMPAAELSGRKVVLDPGHGGSDPGAVGIDGGADPNEADFNLEVALRLRTRLQNAGSTVVMTRTTDATVSLTARRDLGNAENPNCFISTHCNSFSTNTANGTETFYASGTPDLDLATKVQARLIQFLGRVNRGVKQNSFTVITGNPPSCLGELLFISNQTEFNIINSEAGKNNSADAYLYGVLDFIGVTTPSAPTGLSALALDASRIRLTWTDNSGLEDNYKIERAAAVGGPWTQIASIGGNTTSYTNSGLSGGVTYFYRVRAFDTILQNSGYTGTASATTIVTGAPTITSHPQSQTVDPGTTVQFSVVATNNPPFTYLWRQNGVGLSNGGKFSGATSATLTISNVQQTELGNYSVIVSNANGSAISSDASLAVNAVVVFNDTFEAGNLNNWTATTPGNALAISTAQNHTSGGIRSAYLNSSTNKIYHNLGVELEGRSRATFWIYDPSGAQTRHFGEVRSYSGAGYPNGSLNQLFAIGRYSIGFGTGTGTLASEVVDTSRYQGRVTFGSNAGWFNLNASRSTGWHKFEIERAANGTSINFYVDDVLDRTITDATFAPWDTVTMGSLGSGTTAGDAWFDDIKVEYFNPPSIVSQPVTRTNVPGTAATFTVVATNNAFEFQWRKGGVNLINGGNISGATSPTLSLSNVQTNDVGNYDVVISNGAGPITSSAVNLHIAPGIISQPASLTNNAGTTAMFTVLVTGQSPLEFQWRKNGTNLVDGGNISGANSETLEIARVSQADVAAYTVQITNAVGNATSSAATLTVIDPPVITQQPTNQAVALGANVTFETQAVGSAPLIYQWRFNEVEIPGATGLSYTRFNVQTNDSGNYSCFVSNSAGGTVTLDALLSVNVPVDSIFSAIAVLGENVTISWNSVSNKTYRVEFKDDLAAENWTNSLPGVTATGSTSFQTDTVTTTRYYRIVELTD